MTWLRAEGMDGQGKGEFIAQRCRNHKSEVGEGRVIVTSSQHPYPATLHRGMKEERG